MGSANNTLVTIPTMSLLKSLNMKEIFHYEGSLTTPPCSEIVEWVIIHDPQPISTE